MASSASSSKRQDTFGLVHPDVMGSSWLPRRTLAEKLGDAALQVWTRLLNRRDYQGYSHPTVAGLADAKGHRHIAPRTVQRGLARLRAAGLVVDVGWRFIPTPTGAVEVFMRRVFGGWTANAVLVPMEAYPKIMRLRACVHGGRRDGAGRPKKPAAKVEESSGATPTPSRHLNPSPPPQVGESSGVPIHAPTASLVLRLFPSERDSRGARNLVEAEGEPQLTIPPDSGLEPPCPP